MSLQDGALELFCAVLGDFRDVIRVWEFGIVDC